MVKPPYTQGTASKTTWRHSLTDAAMDVYTRFVGQTNRRHGIDIPHYLIVKLNSNQELRLPFFPSKNQGGPPVVVSTGPYFESYWHEVEQSRLITKLNHHGYSVICMTHERNGDSSEVSFDTLIQQDVPQAIKAVLQCLNAKKCFWIGHGLGGNLLLGHLHQAASDDIAGAMLIDTPLHFPLRFNRKRFQVMSMLDLTAKSQLKFCNDTERLVNWLGFEELQLESQESQLMLRAFMNPPLPLVRKQIKNWRRQKHFGSLNGDINYLKINAHHDEDVLILKSSNSPLAPDGQMNSIESLFSPRQVLIHEGTWELLPFQCQQVSHMALSWLDEHRHKCWSSKSDY